MKLSGPASAIAERQLPPADPAQQHRGGDFHTVQFYEDDQFLSEAVAEFLHAGVLADEP